MDDFKKTWRDSFFRYAATIGGMYLKDKEAVLKDLQWGSVVECLNESYQALVKDNSLPPIESLTPEKKCELWNAAIKIAKDKKHRIMICKAIYLLEKITE